MDEGHCGLPADELRALAADCGDRARGRGRGAGARAGGGEVVADEVDGRAWFFLAGLTGPRRHRGTPRRLAEGPPPGPRSTGKGGPWVSGGRGSAWPRAARGDRAGAALEGALGGTGGPGWARPPWSTRSSRCGAKGVEVASPPRTGGRPSACPRARGSRRAPSTACSRPIPRGRVQADEASPLGATCSWSTSQHGDVPITHPAQGGAGACGPVLVGDVDQLPRRAGQVLADVTPRAPYRGRYGDLQAGGAERIVTNAHRINRGQMPDLSRDTEGTSTSSRAPPRDGVPRCSRGGRRIPPGRARPVRDVQCCAR